MASAGKDTVLTSAFSGKKARGIENEFVRKVEAGAKILPFPYQNKLTGPLRKVAKAQENVDFLNLWRGEKEFQFSTASTGEILANLIDECQTQ